MILCDMLCRGCMCVSKLLFGVAYNICLGGWVLSMLQVFGLICMCCMWFYHGMMRTLENNYRSILRLGNMLGMT